MSRYIDADALLDDVFERYCKECAKRKGSKNGKYRIICGIIYEAGDSPCRACDIDDMKTEIEDAPTIEPERKKGKWIIKEGREQGYDIAGVKTWYLQIMCDKCGFIKTAIEGHTGQYNYCPNCGADMRGEQDG